MGELPGEINVDDVLQLRNEDAVDIMMLHKKRS